MQNHTFTSISHISERLHALIAEGVNQFEQKEEMQECKKCVLASTRKRVVVAKRLEPKKFFILSEFPETADEDSNAVFNTETSSGIILNLIEKLGIQNDSYYAFALKCIPHTHIPDDHLSVCVYENLRRELASVMPEVVFCFGTRAHVAVTQILSSWGLTIGSRSPTRQKPEIYLLPTAQELKQFPKWRLPVWSKLVHFKIKKED